MIRVGVVNIEGLSSITIRVYNEGEINGYASKIKDTLPIGLEFVIDNEEYLLHQYDIVSDKNKSKIASKENEIMIVLTKNQELNDLILAQLGYYTQEEFINLVYKSKKLTKIKFKFCHPV